MLANGTFPWMGCGYVLKESGRHVGAMDVGLHRREGATSSVASAKTNVSTNKGIVRCRYLVRYKGCNVWQTKRNRIVIT